MGLDQAVAGAWIGGTIDSTGAVVAAGSMLGKTAMEVAAMVKMIQNVLIGVVAFAFALVWVTRVEKQPGHQPRATEIWNRFPKFILGFVLTSAVFSWLLIPWLGETTVSGMLKTVGSLRNWLFCMAFVSIGLDSQFRNMAGSLKSGQVVTLYVVGQLFNIALTLLAAWALFSGTILPKPF